MNERDDECDNEFIQQSEKGMEFIDIKSKSSCKLSEIQGFVYGGFNSRFWMLRKHIN